MCFAAIVPAIVGALASALISKALAPKPQQQQAVQAPTVQAPPESQAAKTPDQAAMRASAAANGGPTPGAAASTLLTGQDGVPNALLNLGKNTLLGE